MPADDIAKSLPESPFHEITPGPTIDEAATDSRRCIEEEHRALRAMLDRVESTADLSELLPLLEELEGMLEHHFATEESPAGLHAAIGESAPQTWGALEALFEEHRQLLEAIRHLIRSTRACAAGPVAEVLDGVADLAQRLHLHEESETELFVDVVNTDLGGTG